MHAWDLVGRAFKMSQLIIEKYVRIEYAQHFCLLDATEEKCVIHANTP